MKITGGGKMFESLSDIGSKNIAFVKDYIQTERLNLLSEDVGDIYPRKVRYCPVTGSLKVMKLKSMHNDTIIKREEQYSDKIVEQPDSGDVELF